MDDDTGEASGYWAVLEPHWDTVRFGEGHEALLASFERLPEPARTLFVAHLSESEIANGGLLQFFANESGDLAPEAAAACDALGFAAAAQALRDAMAAFGDPYPRDREARLALLERAHGSDWKAIRASRPFDAPEERYFAALGPGHDPYFDALDAFASRAT